MKHKVLDLFAGIGGFSLGLEATGGFETTAFCELDKKAQLVLKKHWPDVPIYEDIKELTYERLQGHSEELGGSCEVRTQETPRLLGGCPRADFWAVEPNVGRVAHGIPKRVDRLKQLGNSVVPQIPYLLGCAILSTETLDAKEDTNAHNNN